VLGQAFKDAQQVEVDGRFLCVHGGTGVFKKICHTHRCRGLRQHDG
jgi:hypothetical protein